jgi:hypothetical protein
LVLDLHSGRGRVFQRQCLDLVRRAAEAGEATPAQVACLTDRILLDEGPQQEYGTELIGRDGAAIEIRLPDLGNGQTIRRSR